ncbi:hypothetical protein Z043_124521 [Scleropages formosus]|uniref:Uncharacterized protein n=1 Tax=Scleropages formosus TaxID=113540 RepID=A0A0P7UF37_SCLFO|nr:hypothetical protein Z043_124521 [Scleropages formosus]
MSDNAAVKTCQFDLEVIVEILAEGGCLKKIPAELLLHANEAADLYEAEFCLFTNQPINIWKRCILFRETKRMCGTPLCQTAPRYFYMLQLYCEWRLLRVQTGSVRSYQRNQKIHST